MQSIEEIRKVCQEPVIAENGWYIRNFVRRVSIYFTMFFLCTPVSANRITLLAIFMGIIAGGFLSIGGYANGLIGVLFLQLFLIFDCADGEIARYKNQGSLRGKYLDLIANDIVLVAIFLGLSIRMLNSNYRVPITFLSHNNVIFVFGLSAIVSHLLYKLSVYYAQEISGKSVVLTDLFLTGKKNMPLKSFLQALPHLVSIINITTIGAIFNLLPYVLIGYGIILPLWWIVSTILRLYLSKEIIDD
ncbi:MAG: hypothetical protein CVV39_02195 [Planctomycetes bacterium HGW-Planctomycetes-1]|nr:MAG: hypothetical protein CVV39_02195 [Planctomycetes bacterium HGW-Planctomycetes-1]